VIFEIVLSMHLRTPDQHYGGGEHDLLDFETSADFLSYRLGHYPKLYCFRVSALRKIPSLNFDDFQSAHKTVDAMELQYDLLQK
jgi:hypothetical protein